MIYPVYILLGPEKGLKEDFINKTKQSLGDCEVSKFYAFDDYEEELYAQLSNPDLFGAHKFVILDEAQEIKTKDKAQAIVEYIKNPSDTVTLLIVSTELYIQPDIMTAIPNQKDCIIKFYELFESKKTEWITDFFRRNNMSIERSACDAIIEKVDNNISEFENVCTQMLIHFNSDNRKEVLTCSDVEDFLVHTREETEFSLFGYIARRKLESSLECFQALVNTSDAASVCSVLPSRLAGFFRKTMAVENNINKGLSFDEAVKTKTFDLDRAITMPKDKDTYKAAVSSYNIADIRRILVCLARYDIKVKECGQMMQQTVLEKCILDIVSRKGRAARKLEFASLRTI